MKIKLGFILDTEEANRCYTEATGKEIPGIPDGCNTYYETFTIADGESLKPAMLILQDEKDFYAYPWEDQNAQYGGSTVIVALDAPTEQDGRAAIEQALDKIKGDGR